jgi:hypothetical protein
MRCLRFGLLIFLLFGVSAWAQQPTASQQATSTQPASDPQAVAVVQAAITALGGATAISQAQNWTFQAQLQGPHANGNVSYSMSTKTDTGQLALANGTTNQAPLIQSHFLPALVGAILVKESQDPDFAILTGGSSTLDSVPVNIIVFAIGPQSIPAQIWYFNSSGLPVLVDFKLPAEIGARRSFPNVVSLSDYRSVSGVLYPHEIVSLVPGKPRELVTIQFVTPGATAATNNFTGQAGDLR